MLGVDEKKDRKINISQEDLEKLSEKHNAYEKALPESYMKYKQGKTGENDRSIEIVDSMKDLLSDYDRLDEMVLSGKEIVRAGHTWADRAEKLIEWFMI